MKRIIKQIALMLTLVILFSGVASFVVPGQRTSQNPNAGTSIAEEILMDTVYAKTKKSSGNNSSASSDSGYLDPDGTYDSKEDVALYLHLYGELPSNYITKKEAQKLGWSGGSLEQYAEGMCIGGSYFGNNEGILPDGNYHECDIDTLGASKRGAKRIVYSEEGEIYYTEDHYETFTLLYTADGPVTEEIVYGE